MTTSDPAGPSPEDIVEDIREIYPETVVLEAGGTWFFSFDPEKHFPN